MTASEVKAWLYTFLTSLFQPLITATLSTDSNSNQPTYPKRIKTKKMKGCTAHTATASRHAMAPAN
jgi:hypothetical protein